MATTAHVVTASLGTCHLAADKLARHEIPRYVRTVDEFPMTE